MTHQHQPAPSTFGRAFALGVILNTAFVVIEVTFGLLAHSLALVADAGHNFGDVLGLGLAWGALLLAQRPPTARRTYGWHRGSILAALANAGLLLLATGAIAWEAIRRLLTPEAVAGTTVIWVAAVGVGINAVTALGFLAGRQQDLNLRAAFAHLAADAALALGVVIAGVLILVTGWAWLDPAVSLVIVVAIVAGTWGLLRDSLNLALDAVPPDIDIQAIERYLAAVPAVSDVHDLHVWGMSTTEAALTAHLVMPERPADDAQLAQLCHALHERFGIEHATLQVERGDPAHPCPLAPAHTV